VLTNLARRRVPEAKIEIAVYETSRSPGYGTIRNGSSFLPYGRIKYLIGAS
jgi:hypothetical protein